MKDPNAGRFLYIGRPRGVAHVIEGRGGGVRRALCGEWQEDGWEVFEADKMRGRLKCYRCVDAREAAVRRPMPV